jgi:hypothetical protein
MPDYIVREHKAIWETDEFKATADSPEDVRQRYADLYIAALNDDEIEIESGDEVGGIPPEVEICLVNAQGEPGAVMLRFNPDNAPDKPSGVATTINFENFMDNAMEILQKLWKVHVGGTLDSDEEADLRNVLSAQLSDCLPDMD